VVWSSKEQWPTALADFNRHNDEALAKSCIQLLVYFSDQLLLCASLSGLFDVVRTNPFTFLLPRTLVGLSTFVF